MMHVKSAHHPGATKPFPSLLNVVLEETLNQGHMEGEAEQWWGYNLVVYLHGRIQTPTAGVDEASNHRVEDERHHLHTHTRDI